MRTRSDLVRVRALDIEGDFLEQATVTAVSSTGERFELYYDPEYEAFTHSRLQPGIYSMEVRSEGLETAIRGVEVTKKGTRETFVLGRPGLRYYHRGRVKVPFEHSELYGVALRDSVRENGFIDLAKRNDVDLSGFGLEEVRFAEEVRQQGIQAFRVAPEKGAAFEQMARAQEFVRCAGAVVRMGPRGVSFLTDEFLCQMRSDSPLHAAAMQPGLQPRKLRDSVGGWAVRGDHTRTSIDLLDICNQIAASGKDVVWAEPNLFSTVIRHTSPAFSFSTSAADRLTQNQPHHELIRTVDTPDGPGAWQLETGSNAVIAIIDGGCDVTHPDLASKIVQTCNFGVSPASLNVSIDEHGTCCAGIAGGAANADLGFSGVAPDAQLVVIEMSSGVDSHFADIFRWCAGQATDRTDLPSKLVTIDVISCSWNHSDLALSQDLIEAFDALAAGNCVVVFSSGDFDLNFGQESYGALAAYEKNLAVGSSTFSQPQDRAPDSSFGLHLALVAPGGGPGAGDTQTTYPTDEGNYGFFSGTSCACPQVAGVVALMQSARRGKEKAILSPASIKAILTASAQKIPNAAAYTAGFNIDCGFGQVDARGAVVRAVAMP